MSPPPQSMNSSRPQHREAQAEADGHRRIDILDRGDAFLDQAGRFVHRQGLNARHDIAWGGFADDRDLADRGQQRAQSLDCLGRRVGAGADLDQRHQMGRIQPVRVAEPLRPSHERGQRVGADGGGGRRDDAIGPRMRTDDRETRALCIDRFGDSLEDDIAGRYGARRARGSDESHQRRHPREVCVVQSTDASQKIEVAPDLHQRGTG